MLLAICIATNVLWAVLFYLFNSAWRKYTNAIVDTAVSLYFNTAAEPSQEDLVKRLVKSIRETAPKNGGIA